MSDNDEDKKMYRGCDWKDGETRSSQNNLRRECPQPTSLLDETWDYKENRGDQDKCRILMSV